MQEAALLERLAPAKVNLTLQVLGRREDGYHLLESLVVFADYGDRLTFAGAGSLSLSLSGPFAGALGGEEHEKNLVLRAARGLAASCGCRGEAAITLEKNLPLGAGLGGGSADAAAALHGLCELWDLRPDPKTLYDLALALGADVPACLNGKPCLMGGIGETLEAAPALPPFAFLLVNPGVALSTPAVFAARRGSFSEPAPWPGAFADAAQLCEARKLPGSCASWPPRPTAASPR